MQQIGFFIAKLIVRSTCFWHHYAHHQELKIYTNVCYLWYLALWFTGRWSVVELWVMCPVCGMFLETSRNASGEYAAFIFRVLQRALQDISKYEGREPLRPSSTVYQSASRHIPEERNLRPHGVGIRFAAHQGMKREVWTLVFF
jgi:hypothetical protein